MFVVSSQHVQSVTCRLSVYTQAHAHTVFFFAVARTKILWLTAGGAGAAKRGHSEFPFFAKVHRDLKVGGGGGGSGGAAAESPRVSKEMEVAVQQGPTGRKTSS